MQMLSISCVTIYACHTRRDIVPMLSEQKELKVINEYVNIRTVVYWWSVCVCVYTHVLFYTLGVVVYSTPIGKLSRITEQIFSNSIISELLLNII